VFDALTTTRAYQAALPVERAIAEVTHALRKLRIRGSEPTAVAVTSAIARSTGNAA